MPSLSVIVVATAADLQTQVIVAGLVTSVSARSDMMLVEAGSVAAAQVDGVLESTTSDARCALVVAGPGETSADLVERWLATRGDLVVMQIDTADGTVRIDVRDPAFDSLLNALRDLAEGAEPGGGRRMTRVRLRAVNDSDAEALPPNQPASPPRPLLDACVAWLEVLLRDAVNRVPDNNDAHAFSVTRASVLQWFEPKNDESPEVLRAQDSLFGALASADPNSEPLAALCRGLGLDLLEARLVLLALGPELDPRCQRRIGFVLDDISRRVGTMGLYTWLLGPAAATRADLACSGALARWRLLERQGFQAPSADESVRVDPFLVDWLLGERGALGNDPRVRRALSLTPWPGAALLDRRDELELAGQLLDRLLRPDPAWLVLDGDDAPAWRALLERGARDRGLSLTRVEAGRLAPCDVLEIEECARRLGRMARLTGSPLVIDLTGAQRAREADDGLRVLLATLAEAGCGAAVICDSQAGLVRLVADIPFELFHDPPLTVEGRASAMRSAAAGADLLLTPEAARDLASRYPLRVDGLERAMHLARSRPLNLELDDFREARFTAACKEIASEGSSHLADRIEPVFDLAQVVLPADRRAQLVEIIDNVRLASRVLDDWKFRDQLPYGRGVTALFFGPPGTGKTMAAMGIARRLGIQLLRLDLSRVISKYIGDTEKQIDQVFVDAQRSGAAILIDEAEALLGKRSEVKDAHDRYANIEVAYLLQRMESYEGLAILTTNMRQTLDPAFLRRLRFIVEFPRPDAEARERIWRQCLPDRSHVLDDQTFRVLATRIPLMGGNIRQLTLRAAFVAAAANERINRQHIAHATRAELAKLGMPAVDLDPQRAREAA